MGNAPKKGIKTRKKSWGCEDCFLLFDTFGTIKRKFPCCPSCGESIRVVEYNGRKDRFSVGEQRSPNISWTAEEEEWCLLVIREEMNLEELCFRTGRRRGAVKDKVSNMKKKLAKENSDANNSTVPTRD